MKKQILLVFCLCITVMLQAQVSKTVNLKAPGTLGDSLPYNESKTITNLTVTGTIDARDFIAMIPSGALKILNLSGASITAYTGTTTISGITTTSFLANTIPDYAFRGCTGLTSIIIPSSVTSIGGNVFNGCTGLTSITIPSSVSYIGHNAFDNCTGLTSINYNATSCNFEYEGGLFSESPSLSTLIIGTNVKSIPSGAFMNCTGLTSIIIPSSVISIGDQAFNNCIGLTGTLTIPSSVISIGMQAFMDCTGLTGTLTIPSSVTSIGGAAFYSCTGLSSIVIPSSVDSIGDYVFNGCTGLTGTLTIPSTINAIGSATFYQCSGITDIISENSIPPKCFSNTFIGMNTNTCILFVPKGSIPLYKNAIGWKDFLNILEMTTAIPTITNASINLYPNPITESFQISGLEGVGAMTISDLNGKTILSKQVISNESISVGTLPKGIYILKVITNEGTVVREVVKK